MVAVSLPASSLRAKPSQASGARSFCQSANRMICANKQINVVLFCVKMHGVIFRPLFRREYLGRQLQSSDQQQAPAVAARS